jgi:hypothetical protein
MGIQRILISSDELNLAQLRGSKDILLSNMSTFSEVQVFYLSEGLE